VLYARVSSADQKDDLQRQVQRLEAFAREQGWTAFDMAKLALEAMECK